jgi:GNAT superfamily N-acetyltransferase
MTDPACSIRRSRLGDVACLADIERSAAVVYFEALGEPTDISEVTPSETLQACHDAGLLWIAADPHDDPVGFLAAETIASSLFVREISVHRDHQRRGIGRLLMQAAMDHAAGGACTGVTLTTDRFIPFNAPFYASLGFVELPVHQAPESLKALFAHEIASGFDPRRRILMVRWI